MNTLDRAIAYIAPRAALKRQSARQALLAYEGAKIGRHLGGWHSPTSSANAEIGTALARLRDRSRDLYRNNPLARKAIEEIKTKTVGTGIIPQSRAVNPATRRAIDETFATFAEECDAHGRLNFYGLQALAMKTIVESGEVLCRFRSRRNSDGLHVPLQFQLLEPDHLDQTKTDTTRTGFRIHGVEFDMLERRTAYWLFPSHPGDVVNSAWQKSVSLTSAAVPASEIAHCYHVERIGQVRGVPRCAPVVVAMRDMDEYQEAVRVRKKIEACFAAFVHGNARDGIGIAGTDEATGERIETFEPGMVQYLPDGKSIEFADPKSGGSEPEYLRIQQRMIASGWQIPYEILTGDLSQISYSSYRGGLVGFRDMIEEMRWNMFIPTLQMPMWKRFIDAAFLAGRIPEADYAVEWGPPAFDMLDRKVEAEADLQMVRNGSMTFGQMVARQGYDPDKQLTEIAEWKSKLEAAGVVLDIDPSKTTDKGKQKEQDNTEAASVAAHIDGIHGEMREVRDAVLRGTKPEIPAPQTFHITVNGEKQPSRQTVIRNERGQITHVETAKE